MDQAIEFVISLVHFREENAHDIFDRLNYEYTPMMLVVVAGALVGGMFFGKPIQCWFPAQFTDSWENYGETYCWAKNTYYLPLRHDIPQDFNERKKLELTYYQWVPFVLICQAILFAMPCVLWRRMSWWSGKLENLNKFFKAVAIGN